MHEPFRNSEDLQAQKRSTDPVVDELWIPVDSLKCLEKRRDQIVEIVIRSSHLFDFLDRVNHC